MQPSDESTNVLFHPEDYNGPILFSFREKAFFGKKKASVRIDTGEWSDKFSLDVAGSCGVVECKANDMTYQVWSIFLICINIIILRMYIYHHLSISFLHSLRLLCIIH